MSSSTPSGHPPLYSEEAVIELVRQAVGSQSPRVTEWHVRRENYVVAAVDCERPSIRLIVKLEVPGERPNRRLDSMAAIAGLVRARTSVPTFDVIAVDVSRREWPWEYLIVSQVPGVTWQTLHRQLDVSSRAVAQRQIGRAAAQLHTLPFDSFGEIGPDGLVADGTGVIDALKRRALRRITTPRYRDVMLDVLDTRADLFATVSSAALCHEDMNPYNLVFELRDGQPVLSGILDFESAWASTGESDLARLELWWFTAGSPIREGYGEVGRVADGYAARRPVLQLLWCLEYADFHPSPEHQAVTNEVCAELGIGAIPFVTPNVDPSG